MEITNSFILDGLKKYRNSFRDSTPFPHIIFDNVWDNNFLHTINAEFECFKKWEGVKDFYGSINKSYCSNLSEIPESTRALITFCNSSKFVNLIEEICGIENLQPDPYLFGGGMHSTGFGGYLKMHVDFNWHDQLQMYRRVNVLIYLNEYWDPSWNGQLWLGSQNSLKQVVTKKKVDIKFNRMIIFNTNKYSWHGHPAPLTCPKNIKRNSIALYYYTKEDWKYHEAPKREYTIYVK